MAVELNFIDQWTIFFNLEHNLGYPLTNQYVYFFHYEISHMELGKGMNETTKQKMCSKIIISKRIWFFTNIFPGHTDCPYGRNPEWVVQNPCINHL